MNLWNRFPYFDKYRVTEPNNERQPLESIKKLKITCTGFGNNLIYFGDNLLFIPKFTFINRLKPFSSQ